MDAWTEKQSETRLVDWHWLGVRELVTLSRRHWNMFDHICRTNDWSTEQLNRYISEEYPLKVMETVAWSMAMYLQTCCEIAIGRRDKLANDDSLCARRLRHYDDGEFNELLAAGPLDVALIWGTPQEREVHRRTRPIRYTLPTIRYSPFKPIARARQLRPEAELRDPFDAMR